MADTDEAAIHLPSNDSAPHFETDLSDETQDFRMLNNISLLVPSTILCSSPPLAGSTR